MPEPYVVVDEPQVRLEHVASVDAEAAEINGEFWVVPVLVPIENVSELVANYDPDSGTSPLVAYSRPLARAIMDALLTRVS